MAFTLDKLKEDLAMVLKGADSSLCNIARDRYKFFMWELKFLSIFLGPQRFAFADGCGIVDVTQKMQHIWMRFYDIWMRIYPNWNESDDEAALDYSEESFDYLEEFLEVSRRDDFIDPKTDPFPFHVPTEIWKIKMEFRAKYSFPKLSLPLDPTNKDGSILVLDFVDAAIRILGDLVKDYDPWSLFYLPGLQEQIQEILKELNLLRLFVSFVSNKCIDPQIRHTLFTHVLTVACHAAMVVWLYLPSQYDRENQQAAPSHEMNALLSDLLQMKIKPVQPGIRKIYIDVLQALKSTIQPGWHPNIQNTPAADGGSVETLAQNLVETPTVSKPQEILQEMLSLLRANLLHLPVLDLEFHLQDMDTVIVDAGLLIYSLYDSNDEKEDTKFEDVNRALGLDLPSNIQPIKTMIYLIIRKAFQSNLPRIHGQGYVDFLLKNLKEFQSRHAGQLASVRNQLQIIEKEFQSFQPFLQAVTKEQQYNKLADCSTQLISKAYEVEYIVGACISKDVPHWCLELWLLDITAEIIGIKATIQEKNMFEHTIKNGTARTSSQLDRTNKEFVGFEDVTENLRDKLLKGTKGRDVISIHGMPGQGKTTLACRLYSDRSVISQFDIRAQCCVSQVYSYKDLLLALFRDAIGEDSQRGARHADELADMLRKTLLPKRYLILVDDVWETSAWDVLKGCFPDSNNRSRVILTTRHHEVAKYASVHSDPLRLRLFNEDESWELLEKEVFGEKSCPPLLMDVGQRIAKMCAQLPLSIALVAGILKDMEKEEECWEKIAENLGSHIHGGSKGVIEQSYQNLPYHLRSCFIYFSAFLEDEVIKISKLTRLWISEGFVISCGYKINLEDLAEDYLENLIGRNLVMVAKRSYSDGKIKACRLHDVLLDFCKEKATEENLLLRIKRDQNASPSSSVYSHKQHAPHRVVFSELNDLVKWRSSCSLVGSVLFINAHTKMASWLFQNFKFLKVLHLENIDITTWFETELVYLRYCSVRMDPNLALSSLDNLWNLETLILAGYKRIELSVAVNFWKLVNLRHLHVNITIPMENVEELFADSSELYDLKTLSTPYFRRVKDAELMLRKTPNLRELRCTLELSRGPLLVLDFLISLETLHVFQEFSDGRRFPICICAPNLKMLKLYRFDLGLEHLSNIAMLPNLQVLKLEWIRFDEDEWEVSNDEFAQLKVLKLRRCAYLKEWTVSDDAFPNLKRLVLNECTSLMEIPSCFGDISSLKSIEVYYCPKSVEKSAQDIREIQVEDYQNTEFELVIKNPAREKRSKQIRKDCINTRIRIEDPDSKE